ncbi:MAG: TIM barrel protein [Saprospiraceae bacterium]|nr:TIM barrel protein [Saprospiraceae bacterium]MDF1698500.1 TIM barrel protein [Saprospiraceae bacterium]
MQRRHFIKNSTVLASAVLSSNNFISLFENKKYKMGYQLYSIRDEMAKNPITTLQALKSMGYQDFETYGYDPEKDTFYGFKSKDFMTILNDLDLSTTSGHFGFSPYMEKSKSELKWFVDQCIEGAKNVGMKYITWPWLDPKLRTIENMKKMTQKLNVIGEQVNAAGLGFAYHNHGFEFEDHNGETGYDVILRDTDPSLVKLQIDMYWVMHSSTMTPKELIKKQPGRFVMWHIKDMDKVSRDYTELGNGSIDYTQELPNPMESGLEYYYIEQGGNYAHNSTQSAADSATYFKKHLKKLI